MLIRSRRETNLQTRDEIPAVVPVNSKGCNCVTRVLVTRICTDTTMRDRRDN